MGIEEAKIIKKNDDNSIRLVSTHERYLILVKDQINIYELKGFKNIKFFESEIDGEKWILLDLEFDDVLTNSFYDFLKDLVPQKNIKEALIFLDEKFSLYSKNNSYEKFRGDFAEALYILRNKNSKKLFETETADINDNGKIIEIKSYSTFKKTINISLKQIHENTEKIAIPLENDSNGISIIELATKISDINFSKYLKRTYSNSDFENTKFATDVNFINITNKLIKIKLPSDVLDAKFTIRIETT